jgi:hypothetical protein
MKLIHGVSSTGDVPVDVLAWLTVNGMRSEKLQFLQLCHQNLTNVFRKVRPLNGGGGRVAAGRAKRGVGWSA